MRAVITGANRGIGLELARQLLARGDEVEAAVRDPEGARELRALAQRGLRLHRVDVTDAPSVAKLAAELEGIPIDLVVNVAGVGGGARNRLPQLGEQLSLEELARTYDVDALGPLRISLATLPNLRRGTGKKLVHVTSGLGSIGDNKSGGYYGYRMAKAALNMMSRSLAVDLRDDGIISFVINPGWVATDMGGPSAPTSVDASVRGMLTAIDAATMRDSGEFLDWKGARYPW